MKRLPPWWFHGWAAANPPLMFKDKAVPGPPLALRRASECRPTSNFFTPRAYIPVVRTPSLKSGLPLMEVFQ